MLSREYADKFPNFAADISDSGSAEATFSKIYGKTLADVQKDLDKYYHARTLNAVAFKARFEKIELAPARAATDLETGLSLAKLAALIGHTDDARNRLVQLANEHKESYAVEEALAYLEWRKQDFDAARKHFQLAVDRGTTSWKTYWDYARIMGTGSDAAESRLLVLQKTLELNPGLVDAQLMMGQQAYALRRYSAALIALRDIKKIDPERAAEMFLMMAYSSMELKLEDSAKQYAEQAQKYAREPNQVQGAERLLEYFRQKAAPTPRPTPAPALAP